jgi:hypothetical protein
MNKKTLIAVILMLLIMPATVAMTPDLKKESVSINLTSYAICEPRITIKTNKLQYDFGEIVKITYKNEGSAVAGFIIGTARPVIPWIIEVATGDPLLLTDPDACYPCVMMYGVLEPGGSLIVEWDQQYYGYHDDYFTPSEQVPEGEYYVELGYWKVIGGYDPPYMVPGGPPDKWARSEIFTISEI